MQTTFFHKDGSPSSSRTTFGSSVNKISFSKYFGSSSGGVTFKNGAFTSRLNNLGQCIGSGLKTGGGTTYFGKNGSVSSHIAAFK